MSHDLGDLVPLSVTVADSDGNPANAGQVNLTITLPDGTTSAVGPITPTTTGVYDHDYLTVQAGRHHVRWVATGANASAFTDAFDVQSADDGDFISLADAKDHLQKSGTGDDGQLRFFISAACQMIADRMGQVSPAAATHDVTQRGDTIVLPRRPVIAVTSVQRLPSADLIPPADGSAGVAGWYLDGSEGVLRFTSRFAGRVRVTYRAGRNPLPSNFRLAALELVAHLWRGSQHNQAGGRPALGETDAVSASVHAFSMPYRVMELLGLKKDQERDEPLVG
ncbi:hypothetical protein FHR32_005128 [Streptosporangium album]|uniref:Uncharacterized protein n=1 Tax=Streptosporangium album TaxID=47479 RepID=A0A7W7S0L6_9ACTN|nr:hypothetical protein [Streptosporangium album]MBB4940751.1 hypothetical protein [Streptosporangium album]